MFTDHISDYQKYFVRLPTWQLGNSEYLAERLLLVSVDYTWLGVILVLLLHWLLNIHYIDVSFRGYETKWLIVKYYASSYLLQSKLKNFLNSLSSDENKYLIQK